MVRFASITKNFEDRRFVPLRSWKNLVKPFSFEICNGQISYFSPILPVIIFGKRILSLFWRSLWFTFFWPMDKANLPGQFSRTKKVRWMYWHRLAWVWSNHLTLPLSFQSCFPAKGWQSRPLFFSLAIIVNLLSLRAQIKQICLVAFAEQRGFDGSPNILFFEWPPLLENIRLSKGHSRLIWPSLG